MNAFFEAVEGRDYPTLTDKPAAIYDWNTILTTKYFAINLGVRSDVPGLIWTL